jgi:hypothetical protein
MKKLFLAIAFLGFVSCISEIPPLSAYEDWVCEVQGGGVIDPETGLEWPKDKTSREDYWEFIHGTGKDGKDGRDGKDGKNGLSAYEIWVKALAEDYFPDWDKEKDTLGDYFRFLKGKDGENGKDGKDGQTPYIGDNGNWWFGDKDTGIKAVGRDGKDGEDGKPGENGKDGKNAENRPWIYLDTHEHHKYSLGRVQTRISSNVMWMAQVTCDIPGLPISNYLTCDFFGSSGSRDFYFEVKELPVDRDITFVIVIDSQTTPSVREFLTVTLHAVPFTNFMETYWRWREDVLQIKDWDGDPRGCPMPYSGGGYWPQNQETVNMFLERYLMYFREEGLPFPDWLFK